MSIHVTMAQALRSIAKAATTYTPVAGNTKEWLVILADKAGVVRHATALCHRQASLYSTQVADLDLPNSSSDAFKLGLFTRKLL